MGIVVWKYLLAQVLELKLGRRKEMQLLNKQTVTEILLWG